MPRTSSDIRSPLIRRGTQRQSRAAAFQSALANSWRFRNWISTCGLASVSGLLGPNGAGKSTFIGCLYGVVLRSGGDLKVFGHDPAIEPRRIKQRLGVVPQENALDEELTVLENMRIYARFEGLPKQVALSRIDELLTICRSTTSATQQYALFPAE